MAALAKKSTPNVLREVTDLLEFFATPAVPLEPSNRLFATPAVPLEPSNRLFATPAVPLTVQHVGIVVSLLMDAARYAEAIHWVELRLAACVDSIHKEPSNMEKESTSMDPEWQSELCTVNGVGLPSNINKDIQVKLGLCHLHVTGGGPIGLSLLQFLFVLNDDTSAKIDVTKIYDVIDEFIAVGLYTEGLALLARAPSDTPFVWMKRSRCVAGLGRHAEAIQASCDVIGGGS